MTPKPITLFLAQRSPLIVFAACADARQEAANPRRHWTPAPLLILGRDGAATPAREAAGLVKTPRGKRQIKDERQYHFLSSSFPRPELSLCRRRRAPYGQGANPRFTGNERRLPNEALLIALIVA